METLWVPIHPRHHLSPRSSDQNSIEKSKTPFNTKKLFDIAHHNQKTSATFQKRIVNPELRVNCLLAHVAMEPANSERKVHYQRELEAEIKRAVIHSRNHKTEDDITLRKDVFCYKLLVLPSLVQRPYALSTIASSGISNLRTRFASTLLIGCFYESMKPNMTSVSFAKITNPVKMTRRCVCSRGKLCYLNTRLTGVEIHVGTFGAKV